MAYLLLPAGAGTTRLRHPALAEHYPDGDYPDVHERTVDGESRRVMRLTADAADALADAGVGEVLPDDYFEGESAADAAADSADDSGDSEDTDDSDDADSDSDSDDE